MDNDELARCCFRGTAVRVTRYNLASCATDTQEYSCEEIENELHHYLRRNRVSLCRDMMKVVVGLRNGAVWIWTTDTDETKYVGEHQELDLACVNISDDGRVIASSSWDETVRLSDASGGDHVGQVLVGHVRRCDVRCVES